MKTCSLCQHCLCKIPVVNHKKHERKKDSWMYGKIRYAMVEIRCSKNQWFRKDELFIYKGSLSGFSQSSYNHKICRHYETL